MTFFVFLEKMLEEYCYVLKFTWKSIQNLTNYVVKLEFGQLFECTLSWHVSLNLLHLPTTLTIHLADYGCPFVNNHLWTILVWIKIWYLSQSIVCIRWRKQMFLSCPTLHSKHFGAAMLKNLSTNTLFRKSENFKFSSSHLRNFQ